MIRLKAVVILFMFGFAGLHGGCNWGPVDEVDVDVQVIPRSTVPVFRIAHIQEDDIAIGSGLNDVLDKLDVTSHSRAGFRAFYGEYYIGYIQLISLDQKNDGVCVYVEGDKIKQVLNGVCPERLSNRNSD